MKIILNLALISCLLITSIIASPWLGSPKVPEAQSKPIKPDIVHKDLNYSGKLVGDKRIALVAENDWKIGLTNLDLSCNDLSEYGVAAFAPYLNSTIKRLDLWGNKIGDKGMIKLAPSLPPGLEIITLSDNGITDVGVIALAEHMPKSLIQINLYSNKIGVKGQNRLRDLGFQKKPENLWERFVP